LEAATRESLSGDDQNLSDQSHRDHAESAPLEGATASVNYQPSSTPTSDHTLETAGEVLETMIDGKPYPLGNRGSAPGWRGQFAGLNILQRIRNLCDQISNPEKTDQTSLSDDDLADAFDCGSTSSMPLDQLDGLAMLPSKETTLTRIRIALDQACCLMQFMHKSAVESLVERIYETEIDVYHKEDRKYLALIYSLSALGVQFLANETEDLHGGKPPLRG